MKIGRPKEFDPDYAIQLAMELFWTQGYDATSLADLIKTMGISKSSFYQTFGSKDDAFQEVLKHYRSMVIADLKTRLDQHDRAFTFLEEILNQVVDETKGDRRGCLLMNTACELGNCDAHIQSIVNRSFNDSTRVIKDALKLGVEQGDVTTSQTPAAMASFLVATMGGMRNLIKGGAKKSTIRSVADVTIYSIRMR